MQMLGWCSIGLSITVASAIDIAVQYLPICGQERIYTMVENLSVMGYSTRMRSAGKLELSYYSEKWSGKVILTCGKE